VVPRTYKTSIGAYRTIAQPASLHDVAPTAAGSQVAYGKLIRSDLAMAIQLPHYRGISRGDCMQLPTERAPIAARTSEPAYNHPCLFHDSEGVGLPSLGRIESASHTQPVIQPRWVQHHASWQVCAIVRYAPMLVLYVRGTTHSRMPASTENACTNDAAPKTGRRGTAVQ